MTTLPTRNRWTQKQKADILSYAQQHGITAASKRFGVSRVSLANWRNPDLYLKRKDKAKKNPSYKERNRKRAMELYNGDPIKNNLATRRYRAKHRFKILVLMSNRYFPDSEKLQAFDLWKIAKKQKMRCALTGDKLTAENMSVDHIFAKSKGGRNTLDNIRLVHKNANLAKRALTDEDFFDMCERVVSWRKKPAPCEGGPKPPKDC